MEYNLFDRWKLPLEKCVDCGTETAKESHTYSGTMKTDANNHWDQCTVCSYKDNLGGHVDLNADGKCDTCNYSVSIKLTITFKNGSSTVDTQVVTKGSRVYAPSTPVYPYSGNYKFVGWTAAPGN